ncbi:hypothetical protein [Polyangium mundeleinium]|uniref:Uncharacterized protein n=1 Tax=Polyangium mundeleinium TaxID=2995306 RepID=A0ABT5F7K6_9BACT|nr:hypothetical protein [Polyangium mundeleinium]MDC0749956.1 hypothetical protein [Polyangium mundeleinium]
MTHKVNMLKSVKEVVICSALAVVIALARVGLVHLLGAAIAR